MKSLMIFSIVSILIYSENLPAQNGWLQIQTGTNVNLKSIKFVNNLTGFVCSESGKIFKSTDGGFSWQMKYDDVNTPLRSLYFINENTGWAGGGKYSFDLSNLFVLKTINGGESWTTVYNFGNFYYTISNLYFLNDQTGFATSFGGTGSGTVGLILKSTNGGSNWIWTNTSGTSFNSIDFVNDQTGFIIGKLFDDTGGDTGYIFKTTDLGSSWNISFQKVKSNFNSLKFNTENTGYAVGSNNTSSTTSSLILKTTDQGNIWTMDSLSDVNYLNDIQLTSMSTGYIIGSNKIFKSTSSGVNWYQQSNNSSSTFNSLFFLNDNIGWIGGNNGMVFKTSTGGEIFPFDTVSPKYFPLKVGNSWTYRLTNFYYPDNHARFSIIGEEYINGIKYFIFDNIPDFFQDFPTKIRVDSLTGNVYGYRQTFSGCNINGEILYDSLKADSGNAYIACGSNFSSLCLDVDTMTIFGLPTFKKDYIQYQTWDYNRFYAKHFGIYYGFLGDTYPNMFHYYLTGCVIDGIVYGDTSTVVTYSIAGVVRNAYTFNNFTSGKVKAVKYDRAGDSIITFAVTNINPDGTFLLTGVPNDSVDIMAYQDDQLDFVPTYYSSTIYWEQATTLYINTNFTNVHIFAYPLSNQSGSLYNLSGHVYKNISETNSLKDAYVYVKNGNDFYIADVTSQNGSFSMGNVPSGNHNIIVNRMGYNTATRNLFVNDNIDTLKFYLDRISSITSLSQIIPEEFKLHQNYPNPFNPRTNMKFDISKKSTVEFRIYDVSGKLLITIGKNEYSPGSYNLELDMNEYSSGIYFVNLITGDFSQTKKIVLLK